MLISISQKLRFTSKLLNRRSQKYQFIEIPNLFPLAGSRAAGCGLREAGRRAAGGGLRDAGGEAAGRRAAGGGAAGGEAAGQGTKNAGPAAPAAGQENKKPRNN